MPLPKQNGRLPNGTFATGNPGGPGNKISSKVQKLRHAMLRNVSESDVRKLTEKLLAMALQGDLRAADLLLSRLLGKPSSEAQGPQVAVQVNQTNEQKPNARDLIRRIQAARAEAAEDGRRRLIVAGPSGAFSIDTT